MAVAMFVYRKANASPSSVRRGYGGHNPRVAADGTVTVNPRSGVPTVARLVRN
ncbi:MAG: hypothetical protein GF331_05660 [Chitinivibrionales bacterium]|nr:hypothetical protein [Chitinivibrionales bacterium]